MRRRVITLTYDSQLSRVRVDATSLGTAATAVVERSTDQVRWTTVRGGTAVAVTAGTMATLDDYEFDAEVVNYYRVTYPQAMSFVAAGTAAHGNNASIAPGVPAGLTSGDLMLLHCAIRNSGAGTPNTPSGWTLLVDGSNVRLFGKIAGSSESAPTVTFTGGVANADTSGQIAAVRGVQLNPLAFATSLNASAQDIAVPAVTLPETVSLATVLYTGWKQDDWTSVAVVSGGTEIGEPSTTTGDDQGIVWDYQLVSSALSAVTARTFSVTGGAAAISRGAAAVFEPNALTQSNSITPSLGGVAWIKSISRPFLNTAVEGFDTINVTRRPRQGVFDVVGRSYPVAVTDLRGSREFDLHVVARNETDRDRLDLVFASGDPVFLHVPPEWPIPSLYAVIDTVSDDRPVPGTHLFTLPMIQVAAPTADIVGATATYQTVVNNYATYTAVLAAFATYQDILDEIAQPSDVVVP